MDDKILDHNHDFDGIVELDNDLPRWWLGIFWVTILLAFFYVPYYHWFHPEKLPTAALQADLDARAKQMAAVEAAAPPVEDMESKLLEAYKAGGWEEAARRDFALCVPCHAADGGGTIGPNFTDDYYIHGGKLTDTVKVITDGVPEKGMISWKLSMKPDQIQNLAFLIHSLRGTTPAAPKAAQGQQVDDKGAFLEQAAED